MHWKGFFVWILFFSKQIATPVCTLVRNDNEGQYAVLWYLVQAAMFYCGSKYGQGERSRISGNIFALQAKKSSENLVIFRTFMARVEIMNLLI